MFKSISALKIRKQVLYEIIADTLITMSNLIADAQSIYCKLSGNSLLNWVYNPLEIAACRH